MDVGGAESGFPVGQVVGVGGLAVTITRVLRADGVPGQYEGLEQGGRPGWSLVVTVGQARGVSREELERELALRVRRVVPLRGVFPLTGPDGALYLALVETRPMGTALSELAPAVLRAGAVKLAIELAETAEQAAAEGGVLVGIRPELTFAQDTGGQLALTGVVPRGERFLAMTGGPLLFTSRYAAPELAGGGPAAAPADVFSICATLATALTGEHPFAGGDPDAQLAAMRGGQRRPWSGPPELAAILERGLSADPARRPSAGELVAALGGGRAAPAASPSGGIGARLFALFGRRDAGGDESAGDEDFPIGARLAGREFEIREHLAGERWRGRYRGRDRAGGAVLVTVAGEQREKLSDLRRALALEAPGIARLRYLGQLSGAPAGGAFDAMVEDEPPGKPIAELAAPLAGRAGLALAVELAAIVEGAHARGLVIGAFFPELIYVTAGAGQLALSGVAPRAERFFRTATRPGFGLPDLFASVYHAPEVLAGGARSAAADVFSLSALAAEWTTGRFPFEGEGYAPRAIAIQTGRRRPLGLAGPLADLLDRGLDGDPTARPAIGDWLAAARRILEGGGP